jgi:periplasmic mercuric ion binding protein
MKNLGFVIIVAMFTFFVSSAFSADTKEVCIQTNLHCGSCASKIDKGLKKSGGVIDVKSDIDTKIVTVKYNPEKTDEAKIKRSIKKLGYNADIIEDTKPQPKK